MARVCSQIKTLASGGGCVDSINVGCCQGVFQDVSTHSAQQSEIPGVQLAKKPSWKIPGRLFDKVVSRLSIYLANDCNLIFQTIIDEIQCGSLT